MPKPIAALRGVRVSSLAAAGLRSYTVTETGELWAWGLNAGADHVLGHGERVDCPLPKPIGSLQDIKVIAVAAADHHALALADDGSVYSWGGKEAITYGALGLGFLVRNAGRNVGTPQRVLAPMYI
jgi:alpha-tubulin suppressor-like RCC1 family protein